MTERADGPFVPGGRYERVRRLADGGGSAVSARIAVERIESPRSETRSRPGRSRGKRW